MEEEEEEEKKTGRDMFVRINFLFPSSSFIFIYSTCFLSFSIMKLVNVTYEEADEKGRTDRQGYVCY